MTNQVCTVRSLTKSINDQLIIRDISFEVARRKITAIVGPNGAGKTTLMKLILGAIKPDSGQITVLDDTIENQDVRKQVGYVPEHLEFPRRASPRHFLRHLCILNSFTFNQAKVHIQEVAKILEFEDFVNHKFLTLSAGMQQKIRFAVGLMHQNLQFLILDEPTKNLDIITRQRFLEFLEQMVKENDLTVFYSSHIFPEVKKISDSLLVINQGSLLGHFDQETDIRNYILHVTNDQLAIEVLEIKNFTVSLIQDNSLLIKLQPHQEPSDFIDLLRKHDITIHSFINDYYVEAYELLTKIQQTTSEKMIVAD